MAEENVTKADEKELSEPPESKSGAPGTTNLSPSRNRKHKTHGSDNQSVTRETVRLVYAAPPRNRIERSLTLVLVLVCAVAAAASAYLVEHLRLRDDDTVSALARLEREVQRLDAGISTDSRRQQLFLGMRDEIMRANPTIRLDEAYRYAELILDATERTPRVSPLFVLALGVVESGFRAAAEGPDGGRGLYQIRPPNGRILARAVGWDFDEAILFDPAINTRMAVLYLDILFTSYDDPYLVLAEYRGGPKSAGLLRASSGKTSEKIESYSREVMELYDHLRGELGPDLGLGGSPIDRARVLEGETARRLVR